MPGTSGEPCLRISVSTTGRGRIWVSTSNVHFLGRCRVSEGSSRSRKWAGCITVMTRCCLTTCRGGTQFWRMTGSQPRLSRKPRAPQSLKIGRILARAALETRCARDQHIGAGGYDLFGRAGIDAAVNLEIDRLAERVDGFAHGADPIELRGNESLPAEAGIDGHDEDEIELAENRLDGGERRRRI